MSLSVASGRWWHRYNSGAFADLDEQMYGPGRDRTINC